MNQPGNASARQRTDDDVALRLDGRIGDEADFKVDCLAGRPVVEAERGGVTMATFWAEITSGSVLNELSKKFGSSTVGMTPRITAVVA